jgi:hypothetical protein
LAFPGECGHETIPIEFGSYAGTPAFRIASRVNHGSGSSSFGFLVFTRERVINVVSAGDSYSGHAKAFPDDNFDIGYGAVQIDGSPKGCATVNVKAKLLDGKKKSISEGDSESQFVATFLRALTNHFDEIVSQFEHQTGITNPESQLSSAARLHKIGAEDLAASVAEDETGRQKEKAQEKAERTAEGGNSNLWRTLGAIALGASEGVSDYANGNTHSPILQTANEQAAQIRAIGDANAAAQQQAAQERVAAQQLAAQQRAAALQAQQQVNQLDHSSGANASGGNGASYGSGGTGTAGASETGYLTPISQGCVSEFWDPKYYNWLSFQNNCGQAVYLSWIAKNPSDTFGASSANLAPGQSTNSGWSQSEVAQKQNFALFVCPAGSFPVDGNTHQAIRSPDESFVCHKQ